MLGLTEEDGGRGDKPDTRKVEEEVKSCLKGKYDDAYDVFAYVDKRNVGKLATDEFVSALVDLLPPNIERRKCRRLAKLLARDGQVDYHEFLVMPQPLDNRF
jgi:Ca2+-binding EF-hand superfamily protein